MGPTEINGLPAHVLLVHVVVVMMPLACLALVLSTWWPAARRRLGVVTPILALIALIAVPITTHAGEWLRDRLGNSSLIARHAQLGDQLLPWAIVLFAVALLHWVWSRFGARVMTRTVNSSPATTDADEPTTPRSAAPSSGGTATTTAATTASVGTVAATSTGAKVVNVVFAIVALAVAVVTVWMVYRIGDSGAQAVWQGSTG